MLKEREDGGSLQALLHQPSRILQIQSKYGGMEPSDAARLRTLESGNGQLKKLLAVQMPDNAMLREVSSKKWYRPMPSGKRGPSVQGAWCEPESGVCSHAGGSIHGALSIETTR
jgi:putative transposase